MHPNEASSTAESSEIQSKLSLDDAKELAMIKELLWGGTIQSLVFQFWSQGLIFIFLNEHKLRILCFL